jgi:hypothetical protein
MLQALGWATMYGALLTMIGWGTYLAASPTPGPCLPKYVCVVPAHIPPVVRTGPRGGPIETIDTHAYYREGHRIGWDECLTAFVHNRCGRKLRHALASNDLDMPFPQWSSWTHQGYVAGFEACRRALHMPDPSFGRTTTRPNPNWDDNWHFHGYRFAYSRD